MSLYSIDSLVSEISNNGLASPNRFMVEFDLPQGILGKSDTVLLPSEKTRRQMEVMRRGKYKYGVQLRCSSMTFPGRGIQTLDDLEFGATKKVPFTTDYNAASFQFIASKDLFERTYFDAWQSLVLNPVSNTVNFWDDYTADVTMVQLTSETELNAYSIKLKHAYPISVDLMECGYDKTNEYQIINVSMIYKYWINILPMEQDVYVV